MSQFTITSNTKDTNAKNYINKTNYGDMEMINYGTMFFISTWLTEQQ